MSDSDAPQKPQGKRNVGASIWQRLRNLARASGDDVSLTLLRYVGERFLYRLSQSVYRDRFVLKGATLFAIWQDKPHRATRDLDFLGSGDSSLDAMRRIITEIATMSFPDDGIVFLPETLRIEARAEGRIYGGLHVEIEATLANTRPHLEMDIAFGESVTPAAQDATLPPLLPELPAPTVRVYPRETVVAEKCEAVVSLGIGNTRMKDFYDLWYLSRVFGFDGQLLTNAIRATFIRRETAVPTDGLPLALTDIFARDATKTKQWQGFLAKAALEQEAVSLPEVIKSLQEFLQPCLIAAASKAAFAKRWSGGAGAWQEYPA